MGCGTGHGRGRGRGRAARNLYIFIICIFIWATCDQFSEHARAGRGGLSWQANNAQRSGGRCLHDPLPGVHDPMFASVLPAPKGPGDESSRASPVVNFGTGRDMDELNVQQDLDGKSILSEFTMAPETDGLSLDYDIGIRDIDGDGSMEDDLNKGGGLRLSVGDEMTIDSEVQHPLSESDGPVGTPVSGEVDIEVLSATEMQHLEVDSAVSSMMTALTVYSKDPERSLAGLEDIVKKCIQETKSEGMIATDGTGLDRWSEYMRVVEVMPTTTGQKSGKYGKKGTISNSILDTLDMSDLGAVLICQRVVARDQGILSELDALLEMLKTEEYLQHSVSKYKVYTQGAIKLMKKIVGGA